MKLTIGLVVIIAALASAQRRHCCGPRRFEGSWGGLVAEGHPKYEGFYTNHYGAYDYDRREFGYFTEIEFVNGTFDHFYVLTRAHEGAQYIIVEEHKFCEKHEYKEYDNGCVPEDAHYVGEAFIGSDWRFREDTFSMRFGRHTHGLEGMAGVSVAREGCERLRSSFVGARFEGNVTIPMSMSEGALNVTMGIREPERWFHLPSFCSQSAQTESLYHLPNYIRTLIKLPVIKPFW